MAESTDWWSWYTDRLDDWLRFVNSNPWIRGVILFLFGAAGFGYVRRYFKKHDLSWPV